MCLAVDAAMAMVNMAIDFARTKGDDRYYLDSVKLQKLLYLGQYCMMQRHGRPLFEEEITAHNCGPYVDGIQIIPGKRGFGAIKDPFSDDEFVTPSIIRMETIRSVLDKYGTRTADEIIETTKKTKPYKAVEDQISETNKPVIALGEMRKGADVLLVS